MLHTVTTERRQHKRYLVNGKAVIRTAAGSFPGELVDVGAGGVLLFTRAAVSVGEPLETRFAIEGYPLEMKAKGRVARTEPGVVGIAFAETPPDLEEALLWLEADFLAALL